MGSARIEGSLLTVHSGPIAGVGGGKPLLNFIDAVNVLRGIRRLIPGRSVQLPTLRQDLRNLEIDLIHLGSAVVVEFYFANHQGMDKFVERELRSSRTRR